MRFEKLLFPFSCCVALWAGFTVFAGAMVTSTGSGMAVPDWPQSFGTWMPAMRGGVFFEHGHRMVAGVLAVLVVVLAVASALWERRRWARGLTWAALVAVLAQAALGGLTVLRGTYFGWTHTDPIFSTAHAALAQALLGLLVVYATVRAPGWEAHLQGADDKGKTLARMGVGLALLIYAQIIAGAVMRHENGGLALLGFPLNSGRVIPAFTNYLVAVNFAHRMGGWLLVSLGTAFALRVALDARLDAWVRRPAAVFAGVVVVQFGLGASVVLTRLEHPVLTSCHVLVGAALFATSLVLALRLWAAGRGAR